MNVELPTASLPPGAHLLMFDAEISDTTARRELRFNVRGRT